KRKAQLSELRKRAERAKRRRSLEFLQEHTKVLIDVPPQPTVRKRSTSNGHPSPAPFETQHRTTEKWVERVENFKRTKSQSAIRKNALDGMFPAAKNKVSKLPASPRSNSLSSPSGSSVVFIPSLSTGNNSGQQTP